jgi:predicted acylesterase/phospholipase RssA
MQHDFGRRPSWLGTITATVVSAAVLLGGCAATIERNPVPATAFESLPPVGRIGAARTWGDEVPKDLRAELKRHLPNMPELGRDAPVVGGRKQIEILALSGGGPDGAFGAGLLTGWTARGDRPEFELVTGVSAGAIIAPFAFLGPAYDRQLEEVWTRYEARQLVTAQFLPGILGGPALADTAPLRELIAKHVDKAFLRQVAAEYRRGRLLTIGTTNIDAKRPVVWNMGEISLAGSDEAVELFRDVILASASIPGLFPPVNIKVKVDGATYDELHVDGGVTRQVYVAPLNVPYRQFDQFYRTQPERRLYVVQNNKLSADYAPVAEKTLPIAASSISTLLTSQNKGDLYRIYRMSRDASVDFNMIAVPDAFEPRKTGQTFDPAYQRALFDEGFRLGKAGPSAWLKSPPDVAPAARFQTARD